MKKVGAESMVGLTVGLEAAVEKRVCRTKMARRLFKNRSNIFAHLSLEAKKKN